MYPIECKAQIEIVNFPLKTSKLCIEFDVLFMFSKISEKFREHIVEFTEPAFKSKYCIQSIDSSFREMSYPSGNDPLVRTTSRMEHLSVNVLPNYHIIDFPI